MQQLPKVCPMTILGEGIVCDVCMCGDLGCYLLWVVPGLFIFTLLYLCKVFKCELYVGYQVFNDRYIQGVRTTWQGTD